MRAWAAAVALAVFAMPLPAVASIASLVADSISIEGSTTIVAEGNVEIYFDGAELSASALRYDSETNVLVLDGPIRLSEGDRAVLLADAGELDGDLRNGILTSARFVLDRQLQMSAARVRRIDGRFTELSNTITSSCRVCDAASPPIWELRSRRIVHDEAERQIYLDDAQFRVAGVPVFYWPRMRLPDPSLTRASGFLFPRLVTTSQLGTGIKVPYFLRLGDHADLTVTPYVATVTRTVEARFRQALPGGDLTFEGALSDDARSSGLRSYLFGEGRLALSRGYELRFDIELVSDPTYLLEYDYSQKDRLDSAVSISRTRRDERTLIEFTDFRTLRDSEIPTSDELPKTLLEIRHDRRLFADILGGPVWGSVDLMALNRPSSADELGRDVVRTSGELRWTGTRIVGPGIVVDTEAGAQVDVYAVNQDSNFGVGTTRFTPSAAMTLRWPLVRSGPGGLSQTIEPVAQLAWSKTTGADAPDEDSIAPELDEGNLFALSRFPGSDRKEEGLRGAFGVNWTSTLGDGAEIGATFGRIVRFDGDAALADDVADWMAAIRLIGVNGFEAEGRLLAEDDVGLTRAVGTVGWTGQDARASASLIRAFADPDGPTDDDTAELAFSGGLQLSRHWSGGVDWRYDIVADRATSAGLSLAFRNECVDMEFTVSQRYTESTSIEPTTRAALNVSLGGVGGGSRGPVSQCRG